MRIISLTILHYGETYLPYALRSVHDAVDAQYVLYTPQGSHGSRTSTPCPDTREMLIDAAIEGAGDKLHWHDGVYVNESEHRAKIFELEPDADCIIVVDSDEIYHENLVTELSEYIHADTHHPNRLRLPFWHYWRSFKRGFMHDPAYPERVIFPKMGNSIGEIGGLSGVIHHFGYCQNSEIIKYKQLTHGHKGEWRKDCDWFKDIFLTNRQYDCHPVGSDAWQCEDMDLSQLPKVLEDHPYRHLDLIP
jgi:hypothetical protein